MGKQHRNLLARLVECTVEQDKKTFSLKDPGTASQATVYVKLRKCQKIQVDGALNEVQPTKCDWCIRDKASGECLFVELKGSDCVHAAEQIVNTAKWFEANIVPYPQKHYSPAYIIARTGIPKNKTKKQVVIAKIAKNIGIELICAHTPANITF